MNYILVFRNPDNRNYSYNVRNLRNKVSIFNVISEMINQQILPYCFQKFVSSKQE